MPPDIIKETPTPEVEKLLSQYNLLIGKLWEEYEGTYKNPCCGCNDTKALIEIRTLIATIIANLGRELEAQLKEKSYIPWDYYHDTEGDKAYIDLESALTLIRSITGISPTR